jgi:predicted methyltransferase
MDAAAAASAIPDYIKAAVADPARPAADTTRDGYRLPAESVAFSGMKPGDKVVDLLPGRGYFTRIFAKVVGPKGHVYAIQGPARMGGPPPGAPGAAGPPPGGPPGAAAGPPPAGGPPAGGPRAGMPPGGMPSVDDLPKEATYGGVITAMRQETDKLQVPESVDVVWTSLNYHDLAIPGRNTDRAAMNKAIFNALKPGGVYVVIDHAAPAGSGNSLSGTLHRVEGAWVRAEVEAAGFKFEAESNMLRNPADTYTQRLDGDTIPTQSDKFVYRFRKPAR